MLSQLKILVFDHLEKYADAFWKEVPKDVADGKIKYVEHVYQGFEAVGQAILDVQTGLNEGKAVVLVADP
jgi:NADPH-dependent curcumin reductase CurA